MINQNLHKQAVALDRVKHRRFKLDLSARDLSTVSRLNAFFVAGVEFGDACKEHPVVFVRAGNGDDGQPQVAPIAVFGLQPEQNLCIDADAWRVRYVPAMLRFYPFALAQVPPDQLVLCVDEAWQGLGTELGESLFNEQGEPSAFTLQVQKQLETYEQDIQRTRAACAVLLEKDLLREMRFDATLPDGSNLAVDGFLTVDDERLAQLSDADVLAFHRNGLMSLIHAHQMSLANMARLVEWHVARVGVAAQAVAQPPAAATH